MIRSTKPTAFTLVELMISIAIVVVLMLGITKVFSLTSQTAGATNQMSSSLRDARAIQAEMAQDFSTTVRDGSPFMIIKSVNEPAFRNKADRDSDRDWSVSDSPQQQWAHMLTVDVDGNNSEGDPGVPGETISPATYNYRNHRLDLISFFTRHRFERQTGGIGPAVTDGPLVSQMNSNEALVWYGHLWLPGNSGWFAPTGTPTPMFLQGTPSVTYPGLWDTTSPADPVASNPYNYYASQWILGRVATLLVPPDPATGFIKDRSGNAQLFQVRDTSLAAYDLTPLQAGSYDANRLTGSTVNKTSRIQSSRYDLAGTSIDDFRLLLYNWILNPLHVGAAANWYDRMMCADVINTPDGFTGGRFQASPFFASPIDAQKLSQQAPIFAPACTQFIVEFAGDFFAQDTNPSSPTYGQVTNVYDNPDPNSPSSDGQIDFIVTWNDADGSRTINTAAEAATVKRQIRWYGMPRQTNSTNGIPGWKSGSNLTSNNLVDVVPIRDVLMSALNSAASTASAPPASANVSASLRTKLTAGITSMTFEHTWPNDPAIATGDYTKDLLPGSTYTCAWNPIERKPKMIRITMTLDDPNAKLPEGQTYQFVFTLP